MANALCATGLPVTYVAPSGNAVHPVFEDFARKPMPSAFRSGLTNALEFNDGKIMMGITNTLENVTYKSILESMGKVSSWTC